MRYFGTPDVYDIYVPILGILPEHRNAKGNALLLTSFMDVLTRLAEADIYVGRVCANAFTDYGEKLCVDLNMTRLVPHVGQGVIFEQSMISIITRLLAESPYLLRRYRSLARRYARAARNRARR
jgi:hypothetical protein